MFCCLSLQNINARKQQQLQTPITTTLKDENMRNKRGKAAGFVDQAKLSLLKLLTDIQPQAKVNAFLKGIHSNYVK